MRKNKLLKIFIAIVLLISIETSVIAASTGVVNVETVRVREKATTDSDIVELVSIGDKITITGEEGNWYKVKVGKVTGYIRKDLLTVDGKNTDVTPTEDTNKDNNTNTPENPDNNVGTSGDVTTNNNDGATTGDAGGNTAGEQPIETVGVTVQANDTTISTIKVSKVGTVGQKVQLTKETKIKILPSANSSNIANLSANTEVTVLEIINSWCRIEAGEYVGWVRIDQ